MTHQRFWEPENSIDDLVPFFPPDDDAALLIEPDTSDLDTPAHGIEVWYPADWDEADD